MAKAKRTPDVQDENGTEVQVLSYQDFKVPVSDIDPAGLRYLLQYGFAKSLQDCVAGQKKVLTDELTPDGQRVHSDTEVAVALHDKMQDRVTMICSGSVGTGVRGPRVTGVAKVMKDIAARKLTLVFASRGEPKPKGEAWNDLIAKYLAKYGDKVKAEAEQEIAEAGKIDIDL